MQEEPETRNSRLNLGGKSSTYRFQYTATVGLPYSEDYENWIFSHHLSATTGFIAENYFFNDETNRVVVQCFLFCPVFDQNTAIIAKL